MYPSIKALMQIKDVTRAEAQLIRGIMQGPLYIGDKTRLQRIDAVLRTYGVEHIPRGRNRKSPPIYYCNTGDTYATTVLKVDGKFRVGCWGNIVERGNYE